MRFSLLKFFVTMLLISLSAQHSTAEGIGKFEGTLNLTEERLDDCFAEDEEGIYSIFRLAAEFNFTDPMGVRWTVPANTCVNGASIPGVFWSLIGGPWSGKYRRASVIHDHYVRTKERTWQVTHRVFYDGMLASGVTNRKAKLMYFAVRRFGPRWSSETKSIPRCLKGDITNCEQWALESERHLTVIYPSAPEGQLEDLLPIDSIEKFSIEEIERVADEAFDNEILERF